MRRTPTSQGPITTQSETFDSVKRCSDTEDDEAVKYGKQMEEEKWSLNLLFHNKQRKACLQSVGKSSELEGFFIFYFVCCLLEGFL